MYFPRFAMDTYGSTPDSALVFPAGFVYQKCPPLDSLGMTANPTVIFLVICFLV